MAEDEPGLRTEEHPTPPPAAPPAAPPAPEFKRCVMCRETIPYTALRCPRCRSLVSLWEGSIHREYFYFLCASLLALIGPLLPWHADNFELRGIHFFSGAVAFYFALLAVGVCAYNIVTRRLLFWPVLLSVMVWAFVAGIRISDSWNVLLQRFEEEGAWGAYKTFGIGFYFVLAAALYVILFLLGSLVVALVRGKKKEPAPAGAGVRRTARKR